ncbi:N-acetyl-gamma-glutamyl-phosphate reductase [Desulfobacterota bacterium AH_259_B03_O07]|nr:N-acetyl-gamma-glutamyl-phosphate reductase [Desulfobacterota bacterium AH_259_B03_O07]
MEKKKVAILGASGYTGSDLLRLLLIHPNVEVTYLTADKHSGKLISDVFPNLRDLIDLELQPLDPNSIPGDVDIVFCALPHGKSASIVKELFNRSIHIIDLGADFRLSYENYKKWYGEHPCPDLISEAVYGITELKKSDIARAKLVANPGCYPESAILGLAPLLQRKLIDEESIIIDSKSGVSGAGRSPELSYLFCEVNEGIKAYKVGEHRHTPEINEVLSEYTGTEVSVSFTPHLIPMDRGILSTIYVRLKDGLKSSELLDEYDEFYDGKKFIRIRNENEFPSTVEVRGSNFCDIGIKSDPAKKTAIIISVIDNLVKGASGQAIQNMNVMMEFDESTGLDLPPLFP